MKAYKVLSKMDNGQLRSWQISLSQGGLIYNKDKVNKPTFKGSVLLCFKDVHQALLWRSYNFNEVWEVEITPGKLPKCRERVDCFKDSFAQFWKKKIRRTSYTWPRGTVGAKTVKLIKKVEKI